MLYLFAMSVVPEPSLSTFSPRAKSAARLYAVQAVYQMLLTGDLAGQVVDDFSLTRIGAEPDLQEIERPAPDLFRAIVQGAERHRAELEDVITKTLKEGITSTTLADKDPLLLAILLCGAYELMAHMDIDAPIIINDYLDVGHSYYTGQETRMINGVLGALKPLYRA